LLAVTAALKGYDPRYMNSMTREQQELMKMSISEAEKQEKLKYAGYPERQQPINTHQLIEMIVSDQLKNSMSGSAAAAAAAIAAGNPAAALAHAGLPHGLPAAYQQLAVNNLVAGGMPRLDGKESPSKQPSRSPLVKEGMDDRSMLMRTSPAGSLQNSMDQLDRMKTEIQKHRTSPYPMMPTTASPADMHEYWKRNKFAAPGVDPSSYLSRPPSQSGSLPRPSSGGMPAPSSMGTSDERQIIRVAQNASPRSDKGGSVGGGRPPGVEAISPPTSDPSRSIPNYPNFNDVNSFHQRLLAQANAQRKQEGFDGKSIDVLEQMKRKIGEAMRHDNDGPDPRSLPGGMPSNLSMGPPNKRPLDGENSRGGPSNPGASGPADLSTESPRKRHKPDEQGGSGNNQDLPDSPGSGEMVIDESARPDSAHSHKTTSPAPHPSDYSAYRGGGPPGLPPGLPQMPPRSSPSGGPINYGSLNNAGRGPPLPSPGGPPQPPPSSGAPPGARYEPLSDDD